MSSIPGQVWGRIAEPKDLVPQEANACIAQSWQDRPQPPLGPGGRVTGFGTQGIPAACCSPRESLSLVLRLQLSLLSKFCVAENHMEEKKLSPS